MKRFYLLLSVLFIAFAVIFTGFNTASADKKPVVLRLVVPSPAGDWPLTWICTDYAKRFNARAKGEYVIEVHAGGALAKLPEYFDALRIGAVEMALSPWGFYAFMDPRLGLIETPFLLNNQEAGAYATKGFLPLYDQILQEKFNQKALGLMSLAGVELVSAKPVHKMEDWKGLLVGSLSPTTTVLIKSLGGAPTQIMWTEFFESLQKKVIDAVANGTHGSLNVNLFEVCKYATLFYGLNSWNGISVNLDVWKKMPKNIQAILQQEATKSCDWMHKTMEKLDAEDLKKMREKKVTIYTVPPAERARWAQALEGYKQKQLTSFGDFGQQIGKIADDANKRFPYKGMK